MSVPGDPSTEIRHEGWSVIVATQDSGLRTQHSLTALNLPRPLAVEADEAGVPRAVMLNERRIAVEAVLDSWRIDDEWWREEISRRYHHLALADGRALTVFLDLLTGAWYTQRYSAGLQTAGTVASAPE
jgi:hypothetical protein